MKREKKIRLFTGVSALAAFALWTAAVCTVDVRPIGPLGSRVGFASLNRIIHEWTGVHLTLYVLTDWLSLIPAMVAVGFALLGLVQWIRRKHLLRVDTDILLLGGFYVTVLGAYLLFEELAVNFRPVLIDGRLEASYPSSTTVLVLCILPTAVLQVKRRVKRARLRRWLSGTIAVFAAAMVVLRLLSGVHWGSDIVGGALLSGGLVLLYRVCIS